MLNDPFEDAVIVSSSSPVNSPVIPTPRLRMSIPLLLTISTLLGLKLSISRLAELSASTKVISKSSAVGAPPSSVVIFPSTSILIIAFS